ncbi:MAG: chloride channel protein [Leptolyngbyaceae bacterium]|nr:chloride channel protein [Leptolyngbyaceae bacterium]
MIPAPHPDLVLSQRAASVASPPVASHLRLSRILNQLQPSSESVVLLLAVLIGGGTGMGVVTFHYLIELIHGLVLEDFMGAITSLNPTAIWAPWILAFVPMLGGIVVGLMRWYWQDFGPSISSLIAAAQGGRELSPLRPVPKMVAASVSLGTGASLGPEGPSVEIGANFGMLLGQVLQVSQERQRLLLGAGAAAGLAAGFNAPIAGVFFALEVVLGTTFATSAVSVVLLAAVVAALIAQIGLGEQPAFTLPLYEVRSPFELPLYVGLGLFASLVSITYIQAIKFAQSSFEGNTPGLSWLGKLPTPLRPVLGGVCLGLVALQFPQILGIGYETVEAMLRDVQFSLPLLVMLLVVKLAMTSLSLGSGLVGGIFAPAMFLGASLGAAYGKIVAALLSKTWISIAAPPAYAMVGMAAVLAGSARAPLTAILLLFELTRDYRIVLPLMAAVGLSVWLVERLKPSPSAGLNLQQMGVNVEQDQNLAISHQILVADVMFEPLLIPSSLTVLQAGQALLNRNFRSALVVDATEQLMGIVTLQDINRAIARAEMGATTDLLQHQPVAEICTSELVYAYPDEWVADVLDRMAARGLRQLPVMEPQSHRLVGLLEQERVALACSMAVTRKALGHHLSVLPTTETVTLSTLQAS